MVRRTLAVLLCATTILGGRMAVSPDLLRAAVTFGNKYKVPPELLIATALQESGGRLDAVGDGGTSFGPYQMHKGGRLTTYKFTPQQAYDPIQSTRATAEDFARYRTGNLGLWAARAQRPANPGAYATAVNKLIGQARKLLGGSSGIAGTQVPAIESQQESSTGPMGINVGEVLNRPKGTSLTAAVRSQLLAQKRSMTTAPAVDGPPQAPASPRSAGAADNAVTLFAQSALGTPYSWGGGSPSGPTRGFGRGANTIGYDCSSLVQAAWSKVGVKLPRTTYGQIKAGRPVASLSQARPGDLLFPHTGHVQLYIGNGKVIEAPYTGAKVRVANVGNRYIAIRRPG